MKIRVKVIPQAKSENVQQVKDREGNLALKIKTFSPAQDGHANDSIIKLIAKHFNIKAADVTIVSGENTRNKIVEVQLPIQEPANQPAV